MFASASRSHKKILSIAIRLAIGSALLAFMFTRYADVKKVWGLISQAEIAIVGFAVFVAVCGEVITAYKWRRLVAYIGGNLPIATAVRASFIGMFYNNFFPGSVGGDIARVLLIARYAGGKARATASAFMQRNTGLAGLFIIGIPSAIMWPRDFDLPGRPAVFDTIKILTNVLPWLVAAAVGYGATNALLFSRTAYERLWTLSRFENRHPAPSRLHAWFGFIMEKFKRFHMEMQGYRFWLPDALALSAVTQLIDIFLVFTLGQALRIDVPVTVLMVAVPVVTLANLLPVTVNGIGMREAMYVALLHSAGVSANQAVALSLMHFAVIATLATAGGLLHALTPRHGDNDKPVTE